jgi:hypothetical protein
MDGSLGADGAIDFSGVTLDLSGRDMRDGDNTGPLSGLPWLSGVSRANTGEIDAWAAFRNRPLDLAHTYTYRGSWGGLTDVKYLTDNYTGWPGRLIISQAFWPEGGGSVGECAAGNYDAHWRAFGSSLVENGRPDTIVRLGWELNGDWFDWSCTDPPAWKSCFRHVAQAIRATAPAAVIDWTINAHGAQNPASHNAYDCYPGDDVVDIVGIDSYDMYPSSHSDGEWNAQCNGPEGLCTLIQFARNHGKRFSVGEWGIVTCGGGGTAGGDNPFYMQKTWDTFVANRDVMAYEAYFNDPQAGNVCSSLVNPNQAPNSSALYRDGQHWGR